MAKKSMIDCELEGIEKLRKYQLAHQYKKVGFGIFALSFVAMFLVAFTTNNYELKQVTKFGILLGLLIVSISKEKIEDEMVIAIRMQSYAFAFIAVVIYALVLPFVDYLVDMAVGKDIPTLDQVGDFVILWMLLFVQVFCFHVLKRKLNAE